jgi:hypothetical protein
MTTSSAQNNELTEAEVLFAKVAHLENALNNSFGLEQSLNLHGDSMSLVFESTTVALDATQRVEFSARMSKIDEKLQEQAMDDFFS